MKASLRPIIERNKNGQRITVSFFIKDVCLFINTEAITLYKISPTTGNRLHNTVNVIVGGGEVQYRIVNSSMRNRVFIKNGGVCLSTSRAKIRQPVLDKVSSNKMSKVTKRNVTSGLLFVSPWIIGFIFLTLVPFVLSLYYSFTDYDVVAAPAWVGVQNYVRLFQDTLFWKSIINTMYYTVFSVPLSIAIGVALALLLNLKIKGMAFYRTVFYLPSIVPIVASSILWLWLFDPQFGLINGMLEAIGIPGPGWLVDPAWSKPALIVMGLWGVGGAMIIYLAGLQDIPHEMYESAELDGAVWWQKIVYITIPMLTPVIFFNLIMGLIGSFQYFTQAYIVTTGGPNDSTLFYSLYLYNNAFSYFHMGYASAMAWILFMIIMAATMVVFKSSARWVFYGGDK
jgi:multiple sugar transport system permease protein